MIEPPRPKRIAVGVALAIGLFGIGLACRRLLIARGGAGPTALLSWIDWLDALFIALGAGLVGILAGLSVVYLQVLTTVFDQAREERIQTVEMWKLSLGKLDEIAAAVRSRPVAGADPAAIGPDRERRSAIDSVHRALRDKDWIEADRLVQELWSNEPSDPEVDLLKVRIAEGRRAEAASQLERIRASREAGDAERVLQLFHDAAPNLEPERRESLEGELARWFMSHIQRRLRTGVIQAEVVSLTARAAEAFGATAEGASLRAGLPTLRRTVGLCPRCGGPYRGTSDACPGCLGTAVS